MQKLLSSFMYLLSAAADTGDLDLNPIQDAINTLFTKFWGVMVGVGATVAVLYAAWIGFKFFRAGGDENKNKKAKDALIQLVVGIVVIAAGAVLIPLLFTSLIAWVQSM